MPEVAVVGHTDTMGDAKANIALGLKRAMTVRNILVQAGLAAVDHRRLVSRRGRPPRQDARQDAGAAQPPRRDLGEVAAVSSVHAPRRRLIFLGGIVPVLVTALLSIYRPPVFDRLDRAVYDIVLRMAGTKTPGPSVVIVDVDERSLATVGQWPWRRDVVGRLIAALHDAGASVIAIDVIFAESDRYEASGATGPASSSDEQLAAALRERGVILGYGLTFDPRRAVAPPVRAASARHRGDRSLRATPGSSRTSTPPARCATCRRWRRRRPDPVFSMPCPMPTAFSGACRSSPSSTAASIQAWRSPPSPPRPAPGSLPCRCPTSTRPR